MNSFLKAAALSLAVCVALSGCGETAAAVTEEEAVAVSAAAAERGEISRTTAYAGRITPAESVYVIGKVSGTVSKTYFDVGDTVKAGDLLYEIDPVDVMLSVNQAKAAYDSAEAQVELATGSTLDGQVLSAETTKKQAKMAYDNAEDAVEAADEAVSSLQTAIKAISAMSADELAGMMTGEEDNSTAAVRSFVESLEESAGITRPENGAEATEKTAYYNAVKKAAESSLAAAKSAQAQAQSGFDQAELALKSARSALALTTGEATEQANASAEASLAQAKAAYDAALAQLDYCKVTTPIAGVVEMKNVSENGFSTSSSAAYVISNKDTMQVTFGVPAATSQKLSVGDAVTVENGSVTHTAVITEIATMIDQTSGLFNVKANITDESRDLLTGIAVKLTAVTDMAEDAVLVPTDAVYYDDGAAYVYVVQDGTAKKTAVTTGIIADDTTEITDGITDGDLVITTWSARLRDGAAVDVKEG